MRILIGSQMGWAALPVIFLVGVAYIWVAERLLGRKSGRTVEETKTPSLPKAA